MSKKKSVKSVGIFTFVSAVLKPWDPDSIHEGIGGSEEAVIYLSLQLAKMGYQVYVFGRPPDNSRYLAPESNPRFVPLAYRDVPMLDLAISWRMPTVAHDLKLLARRVYLWPHDILHRALTYWNIYGFDEVIWLSEWQRRQWISVHPGFSRFHRIYGNGILPEQFQEVSERKNPHSCIYASNPIRGLEILLDIWPDVHREFPDATLDIYYGWHDSEKMMPEKHARMKAQVEEYGSMGVVMRGKVGQEELNKAFARTSLWTYPCIMPETFCITAARAQLSGAVPVVINDSALQEMVRFGYKCETREEYLPLLLKAMREIGNITLEDRRKMGQFILNEFTWEKFARKLVSRFHRPKGRRRLLGKSR